MRYRQPPPGFYGPSRPQYGHFGGPQQMPMGPPMVGPQMPMQPQMPGPMQPPMAPPPQMPPQQQLGRQLNMGMQQAPMRQGMPQGGAAQFGRDMAPQGLLSPPPQAQAPTAQQFGFNGQMFDTEAGARAAYDQWKRGRGR